MTISDHHMVMIKVNIAELKANLSRYLGMVRKGREVHVFDRRNQVAVIVPVEPPDFDLLASRPPLDPFSSLAIRPIMIKGADSLEALIAERGNR